MKKTLNTLCLCLLVVSCFGISMNLEDKLAHERRGDLTYSIPVSIDFIIFPASSPERKLQNYNISNLTEAQKEVDGFIRGKVNISDVNLTSAQGDGVRFVYTYENKTENKTQTWVISVRKISDEQKAKATASHFENEAVQPSGTTTVTPSVSEAAKDAQPTAAPTTSTTDQASTQPKPNQQKGEKAAPEKYVITGVNYMQSSILSEEDKAKMQKSFKKQQKQIDKFEKEFNKRSEQLQEEFDEFDSLWH